MKDRVLNFLLIVTVALALLLSLRQEPKADTPLMPSTETLAAVADPVSAYRERRNARRQREEEALTLLVGDETGDAALRAQAREALLDMQRRAETEHTAEALAIGRGYGDAVCTVAGETLLIVLQNAIPDGEAARLIRLTAEATGLSAENIRISC